MDIHNIVIGIGIILAGVLLDIVSLIFRKKRGYLGIVLVCVLLSNFIANFLWARVPDEVMPHCLGCTILKEGQKCLWDKNELRNITVMISCLYGIISYAIVCGIQIKKKENVKKNTEVLIAGIIAFLFLWVFGCMTSYM